MKSKIFKLSISILTAICILLFYPYMKNANLIKEILWWVFLPFLVGLYLIIADKQDRFFIAKNIIKLWNEFKTLFIILFLWLLWKVFVAFRNPDKAMAFVSVMRLTGFFFTLFVFSIFFTKRREQYIFLKILGLSITITAIYTLSQYLGFDFLNWSDKSRPPGTFANPNFTADFLTSFFPLILLWELLGKKSIKYHNIYPNILFQKSFKLRNLPFISILIIFAVLATQSRSGFVALFAGILTLSIFLTFILKNIKKNQVSRILKPSKKKISKKSSSCQTPPKSVASSIPAHRYPIRLLLIGVLLIELFIGIVFWTSPGKLNHLFSSSTIHIRLTIWNGSLMLWKEKPLLGWGLGSYDPVSQKIKYLTEPFTGDKKIEHSHNWLVELLVEEGIVGSLFFILIVIFIFILLVKKLTVFKDIYRKILLVGILAGTIAILSGNLFDVWFNWWDGNWIFWILIGLGLSVSLSRFTKIKESLSHKKIFSSFIFKRVKIIKAIGIFLVSFSIIIFVPALNSLNSEFLIQKAKTLISNKKYSEALILLKKADKKTLYPSNVDTFKALCLLNMKNYAESEEILKRLIDKHPFLAYNYSFLGQAKISQEDRKGAEDYFYKAFEIEPSGRNALNLAKIYLTQSEDAKALSILQEQLKKVIYTPLLQFYLQNEIKKGRVAQARDFITKLREDPNYVLKKNSRAQLAHWEAELSSLLKDYGHSIYAYQLALILDPDNSKIWNGFGLLLKNIKLWKRADRAFSQAEKIELQNYSPTFNRLEIAIFTKNYSLASQLSEKLKKYTLPPDVSQKLDSINKIISQALAKNKL